MIRNYISLKKQVILTSTLKEEEYEKDKYSNLDVFSIDYSNNQDSKILQESNTKEFNLILKKFNLDLGQKVDQNKY